MVPLTSSIYTITNARFNNIVTLLDGNKSSDLVSGAQNNVPDAQWDIALLPNNKYTIRNCNHGSFVNCEPNAEEREFVFGGGRPQQWRIKETRTKGNYVIYPSDALVYWGFGDGEIGTPIQFASMSNDPKNQWIFTKVPEDGTTPEGDGTYESAPTVTSGGSAYPEHTESSSARTSNRLLEEPGTSSQEKCVQDLAMYREHVKVLEVKLQDRDNDIKRLEGLAAKKVVTDDQIQIILKNTGDHYISYEYFGRDSEQGKGVSQPGFLLEKSFRINTAYNFTLQMGRAIKTIGLAFSKSGDMDLNKYFQI